MNPWSRALNGCGDQDEPVPEAQKMALNVPGGLPREYPREFEQEITLEDGTRRGLSSANGIRRFRAYVLADNHRMLAMLSRLTDVQQRTTERGVANILFTRRATSAAESQPRAQG
jgi:hypothetical protein